MAGTAPAGGTNRGLVPGVGRRDLAMPLGLVGILGLMIVPLPTVALDVLLAFNVTAAVVILLTAIQVERPLDFSVFPSMLLITTLFRLSLNVATTRLILLHGDEGTEAAGEIIETFGQFVVGGSYVVGIVIFLILTLINFVVITRGAGRIAEVSARFTLDALPGKQMSIDSDLAAGLITQDQARARRKELAQETEFYGAMDGASRFVRGDAIAGLIITAINIVGGLVIGIAQLGMAAQEAAETYTVLTIGDGLVSQIPAILISTAAGVVVTRAATALDLGDQMARQLLSNPKVLMAGAIILAALALIPGMPRLTFFAIAAALLWMARRRPFGGPGEAPESGGEGGPGGGPAPGRPSEQSAEEAEIEQILSVEPLELEVGYSLVPLVNRNEDGSVVRRIDRLRRNFARDLGIVLPPVHIRDNLELSPGEYRLVIHGVEAARGEVMADRLLAMNPGDATGSVEGIETIEPAFGLPALWIRPADRGRAELAGYTVVEPSAVVITQISEVLQANAHKLLGREELQQLLEVAAQRRPRVVEELIPDVLSHAEVLAVLRGLLEERVSIRDLPLILESLAEAARFGKQVPFLVDQVRQSLGPAIVQELTAPDGRLHVAIMDAATEDALRGTVVRNEADVNLAPDLQTAQALLAQLQQATNRLHDLGYPAILLTPADLRYPMRRFAGRFLSQVHILAQTELPPRVEVVTDFTVQLGRAGRGARTGR
ncbi:MAG: flagellar biosynthesis protein FlhA [Myxococcota bacterium]